MTLRKFVYRNIYLKTPGWEFTRQLAKRDTCDMKNCKGQPLHLHHVTYTFFVLWYRLFWLAVLALFFTWKPALVALFVLAFCPDFLSRWQTLCAMHHERIHKDD